MQHLSARSQPRGRIAFFVPRWLEDSMSPSGMPYRVIPVLSSLTANGFAVDFFTELHDGWKSDDLRRSLDDCAAAVAWCAELNPGLQVPGLIGFLERVRAESPATRRIAGGGFFPLVPPPRLDLEPLTDDIVTGQEVDALSRCLLGEPASAGGSRECFDVHAARELDLRPFLRPESVLFGNDEPSLQIPTGLGCGKHCPFCFYEQTQWRVLPADDVVDLVAFVHERYDVRQFLFGELDFLASRSRAVQVANGLVERDLPVRWFGLGSIPDLLQLTEPELELQARSGLATFELGTEAGSNTALRKLGKHFTTTDAIRAHERLVAHGITPVHNFVFGWPGETRADQHATRHLIDRLHSRDRRVLFNFRLYQAIPSTTMGEQALRYHGPLPRNLAELREFRIDSDRQLPWLSKGEEQRMRFLTEYVLPLAYHDVLNEGSSDRSRHWLKKMARWRSRLGFMSLRLDRRLFRERAAVGLPSTYLP